MGLKPNWSKVIEAGYSIVKGWRARRDLPGQVVLFISNGTREGQMFRLLKSEWEEKLSIKLKHDYEDLMKMKEIETDNKKLVALEAARSNMLSCNVFQIRPKLCLDGFVYDPVYITSVRLLIGVDENG